MRNTALRTLVALSAPSCGPPADVRKLTPRGRQEVATRGRRKVDDPLTHFRTPRTLTVLTVLFDVRGSVRHERLAGTGCSQGSTGGSCHVREGPAMYGRVLPCAGSGHVRDLAMSDI